MLWLALALVGAGGSDRLIEGNPSAPVRVIIYEDLQCSDCAAFRRMLDDKLLPAFGRRVAFEHRDFPLAKHAWSRQAAIAARFFERLRPQLAVAFRRHMMQHRRETSAENFKDRLAAFARDNGVDPAKAQAALEDPQLAALVEADLQEGVARGVARVPTVFINGRPFVEKFAYEEIARAIEAALGQ